MVVNSCVRTHKLSLIFQKKRGTDFFARKKTRGTGETLEGLAIDGRLDNDTIVKAVKEAAIRNTHPQQHASIVNTVRVRFEHWLTLLK